MPLYLWIRLLAAQRLQEQHRHLGAAARDAGREVSLKDVLAARPVGLFEV